MSRGGVGSWTLNYDNCLYSILGGCGLLPYVYSLCRYVQHQMVCGFEPLGPK